MSKNKTIDMSNSRTVENESKRKEEPPSPRLLHFHLHPHFCYRHSYFRYFYLSTFLSFDQSWVNRRKIIVFLDYGDESGDEDEHTDDEGTYFKMLLFYSYFSVWIIK